MKKSYVKPVLSASMEGTLEGVYAYGNAMGACGCGWWGHKPYCPEKSKKNSKNSSGCNGYWIEWYDCHWPFYHRKWVPFN